MEASVIAVITLLLSKFVPWARCLCKGHDVAIVVPNKCGKSRLLNSLDVNYKNKYIFCDIGSDVWNSLSDSQKGTINTFKNRNEYNNLQLFVLPLYRDYMNNLKQKFPEKRVCFLFNDISLPKLLGIKWFLYIIPSQNYLDEILKTVSGEPNQKEVRESVNKIIQLKGDKVQIVNTFDDMLKIMQKQFRIKLKY